MNILHLSYHKGCINDFNYICNKLNLQCHVLSSFKECNTDKNLEPLLLPNNQHYNVTNETAKYFWNRYKDYFNNFDCIITSDTAPLSRIFLQNNWNKKLIIWICNRFDYSHGMGSGFPDKQYYELINNATKLINVHIIGYTAFENFYCKYIRNIDIGDDVITPTGGISDIYNNFIEKKELNDTLFVPPYNNDTIMMDLKTQLEYIGFKAYTGKYSGPMDLTNYKAVVHIPYAWSNLAFFEMFQLGIVYFIPTIDFLLKLARGRRFYWSPPFITNVINISEWYNDKHKDLLIFFDSWEELKQKINTLNYQEHKLKLKEFGEKHIKITLNKWKNILYN
tara:strand:- start:3439 stop:4446 length:1008 start_codon:yes stop_codon:yes gene_type:complete